MSNEDRYNCQIKLPNFGVTSQESLRQARVLLVGVGGLGCPAAQYLAAAGIGTLTLVDFDVVSFENLHRQILFSNHDVGSLKVEVAKNQLQRQNPDIAIKALALRLTPDNIMDIIKSYDVVLDCTDNFEVRYLLNDACVLAKIPLVYGAAYQYQGQVAVWNVAHMDGSRSPHYRDIFPAVSSLAVLDCNTGGVTPTLTGIIGCMQANEAIKYLTNLPGLLASKLLVFDAQTMESHIVVLPLNSKINVTILQKKSKKENQTISTSELRAGLENHTYELINVGTSNQPAQDIGGKYIPLSDILNNHFHIRTTKPVVFYCDMGKRSAVAVDHMRNNYPDLNTYSLEGGANAWQKSSKI